MLSLAQVKKYLNPSYKSDPENDFRIIRSWAEYNGDKKSSNLEYLCYELEIVDPNTGEKKHYYKAVRFLRVERIPKSAKQSTSFMDMQAQVLSAVHDENINLVTVIANIIEPVSIGLLYLYGTQGVSDNIEDAKMIALNDFEGFIASMQGVFRVLHMRMINAEEAEWLRLKMSDMEYMTAIRGIPKANTTGEDIGDRGMGGKNLNPESEGTLEELITALADYEYVIEVLSTPVYNSTLKSWAVKTEKQMTEWNSQLQGTKGLSMNISIPMMYMASTGQNQGWSKNYTDSETVSYNTGQTYGSSYSQSHGYSLSQSIGESFGLNHGKNTGVSFGENHSVSNNISQNLTKGYTEGITQGQTLGQTVGQTQGQTIGYSQGVTKGATSGVNIGRSTGQSMGSSLGTSSGLSVGQSVNKSFGNSFNQSFSNSLSKSSSESTNAGLGFGKSTSDTYSVSSGESNSFGSGKGFSTSDSVSHNVSGSASTSFSTSDGVNNGLGRTSGIGGSTSSNNSANQNANIGLSGTHSNSQNVSGSENASQNFGAGPVSYSKNNQQSANANIQDGFNKNETASGGLGYGGGNSTNLNGTAGQQVTSGYNDGRTEGITTGAGYGSTYSSSSSESYNVTNSSGYSKNYGASYGTGQNVSYGNGVSVSTGSSIGQSQGSGASVNQSSGSSYGANSGTSSGMNASDSVSVSVTQNRGSTVSSTTSQNVSQSLSISDSQSNSESLSNSYSNSISQSQGVSNGTSDGTNSSKSYGTNESESYTQTISNGSGQSWGTGQNTSKGQSYGVSNGRSTGTSVGSSGGFSQGTSGSMGLSPSIGYNKSYQWLDQQVKDILEMLEYQNERIKIALRGEGAFYTYCYIACPSMDALAVAQAAAKSTWQNKFALTNPLQVLDLSRQEQEHLLYHFSAFSTDVSRENVYGVSEYKYATVLLPHEYVAYTHIPRISEGGIDTIVNDIPKFRVPGKLEGDIFMGCVLNSECYTFETGYRTPYEYRINTDELMHGIFTGQSRSGKTVAAMRFVKELANSRRTATGKRLRIVCLDPKQDWRGIARFVEPERFRFYSLGNTMFRPINFNPCKIPAGVYPQHWIDGVVNIYCRAYGLLERGKQIMSDAFYDVYKKCLYHDQESGKEISIFDLPNDDDPDWGRKVAEVSTGVTFAAIYDAMKSNAEQMEKSGKSGRSTKDGFDTLLERLSCFSRPYSIERRLFSATESDRSGRNHEKDEATFNYGEAGIGDGVDDLIGDDDVTVFESFGLESTFASFVFGVLTSGFYRIAKSMERGFLHPSQYETVVVIEEANKVLTGNDAAGTGNSGSDDLSLSGQSEFEEILDQAAGYGLFIIAITQKISMMPSSVVANCGMLFVGKIAQPEDVNLAVRMLGREERIEDRDVVKWLPMSPTGWFICRSNRGYDFRNAEPVLVQIEPLNNASISNAELDSLINKGLLKQHQEDLLSLTKERGAMA